jgi:hypothetical protein
MRTVNVLIVVLVTCGCFVNVVRSQSTQPTEPVDWRAAEKATLADPVQLTRPDRFLKAGEAYFSTDGRRIIFQAIEVPPTGQDPDEFYGMYVADLVQRRGRISRLDNVTRISPPGSFNTCGWFVATNPNLVIFASTITSPTTESPGYQRAGRKYRWQFPIEMDIYRCDLTMAGPDSLVPLLVNPKAYLAECSVTADGRHLLYTSLETGSGDLFVRDLQTGTTAAVVTTDGYDGGPFFSPDGMRICYRSDRRGDDLLQIFVGDLAINESGTVVGLEREYQLTNNGHVNFAPFWHPGGRYLVYITSEQGHHNYEIYLMDADPGNLPGSTGTVRYGTAKRRVTYAPDFDGFPAFNSDGSKLLFTSKRDGSGSSQVWVADFVMELDEP